jgi:hypothetical protein
MLARAPDPIRKPGSVPYFPATAASSDAGLKKAMSTGLAFTYRSAQKVLQKVVPPMSTRPVHLFLY